MPQTFADKTAQLGMDPTLAKVIVTWPGLNSNTKAQILALTAIVTADATDLPTAIALANANKATINLIIAALKA